ncbi:uncharacterized protein LOC129133383 [Agelaius phoeniceus]|uniref:uncharacterized protein LOC129133383 n=1 Tax=Agelaius phoeniceus TaxID=39638 RepID=UPI004055133C
MAGTFLNIFKVFRQKTKRSPEVTTAQQLEKPEQIQTLKDGAALDKTQEQEPGPGRFHRTLKVPAATPTWAGPAVPAQPSTTLGACHATSLPSLSFVLLQRFRKFLHIWRRNSRTKAAEVPAQPDSTLTKFQVKPHASPEWTAHSGNNAMNYQRMKAVHMAMTESMAIRNTDSRMTQGITNTGTRPVPTAICAPTMDFFEDSAVPSQQQVPAIVRNIHQRLVSHGTVDARLQSDIVKLAEKHPVDVVLTLLRCAPTCDRAATMIWRTIGSSQVTMEKVLPTLVRVMEDWPLHSTCTSDRDDTNVSALAATLVIWVIVQVPQYHEATIHSFYPLFVALLFHVAITTQQMPPEGVDTFWRACQEEHHLPSKLNRSQSSWPSHALVARASAPRRCIMP